MTNSTDWSGTLNDIVCGTAVPVCCPLLVATDGDPNLNEMVSSQTGPRWIMREI